MILSYHSFGLFKSRADIEVSGLSFLKQMLSLRKYQVVDIAEYTDPESEVVITFDDAYATMLRIAFPLLKLFRYKFTVFICDRFLKSNNPLFLSYENIQALKKSRLCRIGYHSKNHLNMQDCHDWAVIQDELSCPPYVDEPPCFAWPYWRYNNMAMRFVANEYYCARSGNGYAENTRHSLDSIKMTECLRLS